MAAAALAAAQAALQQAIGRRRASCSLLQQLMPSRPQRARAPTALDLPLAARGPCAATSCRLNLSSPSLPGLLPRADSRRRRCRRTTPRRRAKRSERRRRRACGLAAALALSAPLSAPQLLILPYRELAWSSLLRREALFPDAASATHCRSRLQFAALERQQHDDATQAAIAVAQAEEAECASRSQLPTLSTISFLERRTQNAPVTRCLTFLMVLYGSHQG